MIKLSVIIPVYNQEGLILRAIQSVPPMSDIEVIVVDDCSNDGTYEVVRLYQAYSNANIIVLRNDKNMGVGYTVNRGLDVAQGEYVVLLGSDDYFVNLDFGILELDGTDLIYFPLEINDGTFIVINDENKFGYCGSVKFMRRELIGGLRNPEIRQGEDWYFYKELMKKSPTEKFLDKDIMYKHYNYPRRNSLTDLAKRGIMDDN